MYAAPSSATIPSERARDATSASSASSAASSSAPSRARSHTPSADSTARSTDARRSTESTSGSPSGAVPISTAARGSSARQRRARTLSGRSSSRTEKNTPAVSSM